MATDRILIVDDDPLNRKIMAARLLSGHYETFMAENGEEALQKAIANSPDLILLDVMMPDLDGYEVTRRLKKAPETRDIPIILITALHETQDKITGLEAGADEFLNKPVDTAELIARVKTLLRIKKYQDQLKNHLDSKNLFSTSHREVSLPLILAVEDDEKDIRIINHYLSGQPYRVIFAKTGQEAISFARQQNIDVIVLDILLPDMSGFDICRQLKANEATRDIQILAVTCMQDMDNKIKCLELGADDCLIKPINMYELRARINSLIRRKSYIDKLHTNYATAVQSAITDKLTGLYNHAYFKYFLEQEIRRSERMKYSVSLIMIDIDDFKQYNDNLGHLTGDEILQIIGNLIRNNIRTIDVGARYGGEEFAITLPDTDLQEAYIVAERLRRIIFEHSYPPETTLPGQKLSVSMGIAEYPFQADSTFMLIQNADKALYKAKREGKNRVCNYDECQPSDSLCSF